MLLQYLMLITHLNLHLHRLAIPSSRGLTSVRLSNKALLSFEEITICNEQLLLCVYVHIHIHISGQLYPITEHVLVFSIFWCLIEI